MPPSSKEQGAETREQRAAIAPKKVQVTLLIRTPGSRKQRAESRESGEQRAERRAESREQLLASKTQFPSKAFD